MGSYIYFLPVVVFVILCSIIYSSQKTSEEKMEEKTNISNVRLLEILKSHVNNLDIPKYNKEKILKVVDFELEMVKRDVFLELGKQEYEKSTQVK